MSKINFNKYFSIIPAAPRQASSIIYVMLLLLVFSLINVYFSPTKLIFNDVAGINSVNGCPLFTFTGIPCPLCGEGRVFTSLTRFQFTETFYYNPLGLVFYIISGFIFFTILILAIKKKMIQFHKPAIKLWYIPVLFLIIMWVLNILYGHHH
ncbi:MAG: DUF2752 domain-containing protein [Ignavibacteria bacterium]|nr:DUF2752 domain-containing protein [Ignavibacteria bacterium]